MDCDHFGERYTSDIHSHLLTASYHLVALRPWGVFPSITLLRRVAKRGWASRQVSIQQVAFPSVRTEWPSLSAVSRVALLPGTSV